MKYYQSQFTVINESLSTSKSTVDSCHVQWSLPVMCLV